MKTKKKYFMGYRGLINEILKLCFKINDKTRRSAFFELAGHVGLLRVYVSIGKETNYNDRIFYVNLWSSSPDIERELSELKQKLIDILNDPNSYGY